MKIHRLEQKRNQDDDPEESRQAWRLQLSSDPNAGHSLHHSQSGFGLTREKVNARLALVTSVIEICENAKVAAG